MGELPNSGKSYYFRKRKSRIFVLTLSSFSILKVLYNFIVAFFI